MNIEIIRNTLYKSYLESFYCFCKNIGDETADVMCEILAFEADRRLVHTFQTTRGVYIFENKLPPHFRCCQEGGGENGTSTDKLLHLVLFLILSYFRAFIITINSFGTELTKDDREKLYPTCGKLYPDGLKALARADDYEQVSRSGV